jgi:hypothetical protein
MHSLHLNYSKLNVRLTWTVLNVAFFLVNKASVNINIMMILKYSYAIYVMHKIIGCIQLFI